MQEFITLADLSFVPVRVYNAHQYARKHRYKTNICNKPENMENGAYVINKRVVYNFTDCAVDSYTSPNMS